VRRPLLVVGIVASVVVDVLLVAVVVRNGLGFANPGDASRTITAVFE
jgi:hypothetical protein